MDHEFPSAPSFDEALKALKFGDEVQRLVLGSPNARAVHQSLSDLYGLVKNELRARGVVPITLLQNNRDVIERCDKIAHSLAQLGQVIVWMVEKAYEDLSDFNAFVEKPAEPVHPAEFPPPDDPIPPAEGETAPGTPPTDGEATPGDPPKDETDAPKDESEPAKDETDASQGETPPATDAPAEAPPEADLPAGEPEPPAPPSTNRGRKGK